MTDGHSDTNRAILDELEKLNLWLRVLALPALREQLSAELRSESDWKIYQASTGGSSRVVAKAAGVSQSTVVGAWNKWAAAGIVAPTATSGRFKRLVDLESIGIRVD